MRIITVDGIEYRVKYRQNKEEVTNEFGTAAFNYPNFVGSKLRQNSTSSDKYAMTFAIHRTLFVGFKESLKKFVINEDDAIQNDEFNEKLTKIFIVHDDWGLIKGNFVGEIKYDTSSEADIICSATFQEHTEDEPLEKKDKESENEEATDEVDSETEDGELDEEDRPALLKLLDALNALYSKIKNSAVIAAFNDLKSLVNSAILNYKKIMNAVKKILALPGNIINNVRGQLDFFKKQAEAIKIIPFMYCNFLIIRLATFSNYIS